MSTRSSTRATAEASSTGFRSPARRRSSTTTRMSSRPPVSPPPRTPGTSLSRRHHSSKKVTTARRSRIASAASYVAWLFQPVVWQYGGAFSDADFNILINEPEAVAAGQFYQDSIKNGWATTPEDQAGRFHQRADRRRWPRPAGSTASPMTPNSRSAPVSFRKGPAGFGCCTGGAGLAVLATRARRAGGGFKFIEWLTSPEQTEWWSQNTGYMPVRKSAVESADDADVLHRATRTLRPRSINSPRPSRRMRPGLHSERRPDHRQGSWSAS